MDAPETDSAHPGPSLVASRTDDAAPWRPSLLKSPWYGAKAGFYLISFVAVPISLLALIAGLIPTAFGLGTGRGFGVSIWVVRAVGLYFVLALFGACFGAPCALIGCLILRLIGPTTSGKLRAFFKRPIRLSPRRRLTDEPRPRRRWRPLLWWLGVPVLVILGAACGVGIYAGRFVDRRLADAIAAADQADPAWRVDDLLAARERVPDAENSAIVVAKVVSMFPEETWPRPSGSVPGFANSPQDEVEQAYDRIGTTAINVQLDDETAATLQDALSEYSDAVELARTVADYKRGRHELNLTSALIDTSLRETQGARSAARLLMADAAIRAQDGDIDGALDSCRAILGVGRSIGDELFLVSGLVRAAIGEVAMTSARRVLAQGEPSDATLAKLQAVVLDELAQPLLLQGLRGERAVLDEIIRRIRDAEIPIAALSETASTNELVPPVAPWGKLSFDNQRAVGLEWMNELVAIAQQPPFKRPPLMKAWEAEVDRVLKSPHGKFVATLPLLMSPAMAAASGAQSRYQAELGATAILLAAERHRRKTGTWPASIAAIDSVFLANPPVDPFTGEPYRLERRDGQLLIYSLGPNLKDEHGAYEPKRLRQGGPDDFGTGAWDVPLRRRPPDD
jgi:hypothetical protein